MHFVGAREINLSTTGWLAIDRFNWSEAPALPSNGYSLRAQRGAPMKTQDSQEVIHEIAVLTATSEEVVSQMYAETLQVFRKDAQILDTHGLPIPRLYGAGNCIASPVGQGYWGAGSTLGPALTFGTIAGRNAMTVPVKPARVSSQPSNVPGPVS